MDKACVYWLLVKSGRYKVDIDLGIVYGRRNNSKWIPLKPEKHCARGNRLDRIRLNYYKDGKKHKIRTTLGRAIWIVSRKRAIPKGFEVHHKDENHSNHNYLNLRCLYKFDHDLEHQKKVPF